MAGKPDYRQHTPPEDTAPTEYTWMDRRAELYDMIEQVGNHRNLERSQAVIGERYGVTQQTICKDIKRINAFRAEQLHADAAGELETLKTKAVLDLLEEGESAKAYHLMATHYRILIETGHIESAPAKHEHSGPDGEPINVSEQSTALTDEDRALLDSMFGDSDVNDIVDRI